RASKDEIERSNNLKAQGNMLYASTEYTEAVRLYTEAIGHVVTPKKIVEIVEEGEESDRVVCNEEVAVYHCNRAASYLALKEYDQVISDCTEAIDLEPSTGIRIKSLHRRAQAYESQNKLTEAMADFKAVLEHDSSFAASKAALVRLPPLIKIKEEKEREEMMSKLKDLGNTILGKFGLSTDNFQFVKDPNSGGYSVNFNK
ncbi:hypothetical protein SAMD00019534_035050, partial [Acytostelium subglobosum LB1]|uniref:hypothetical protein n=1 Tax=Acytostelium subglobosum LB1 TaxID=1410327 RepID=UPI000644ED25